MKSYADLAPVGQRVDSLFVEPVQGLSQQHTRPKGEWAIDSEAMRARGIIVLVKSNKLVKNIETKHLSLVKLDL